MKRDTAAEAARQLREVLATVSRRGIEEEPSGRLVPAIDGAAVVIEAIADR